MKVVYAMLKLKDEDDGPSSRNVAHRTKIRTVNVEEARRSSAVARIGDRRPPRWVGEYDGQQCEHHCPPPLCAECKDNGLPEGA